MPSTITLPTKPERGEVDWTETPDERRLRLQRERSQRWRDRHPERNREAQRRWRADNPEVMRAHHAAENGTQSQRARNLLNKAKRKGRIVVEPCLFCDNPRVQAHHHDYEGPFDVTWLCSRHHIRVHKKVV